MKNKYATYGIIKLFFRVYYYREKCVNLKTDNLSSRN